MMKNNLDELLQVLEKIRLKKYPEIPAEIIEKILKAQFENQDDEVVAKNLTKKIIDDFLNKEVS